MDTHEPHLPAASAFGSQKRTAPARIGLAGARAAYIGPPLDLAPHRNAAATLAIALETPFALTLPGAPPAETSAALIPPSTRHHLRASGPMLFLYLDPLSDDPSRLDAQNFPAARSRLLHHQAALATADIPTICAALHLAPPPPTDPRIARVMRLLDANPAALTRAAQGARLAGLSPSRFQALFHLAAGVPFRRYRLWRRMAAVLRATAAGATLTEAAHAAGFSSSAHLSTAFRAMFGITPSALRATGVDLNIFS